MKASVNRRSIAVSPREMPRFRVSFDRVNRFLLLSRPLLTRKSSWNHLGDDTWKIHRTISIDPKKKKKKEKRCYECKKASRRLDRLFAQAGKSLHDQ